MEWLMGFERESKIDLKSNEFFLSVFDQFLDVFFYVFNDDIRMPWQ